MLRMMGGELLEDGIPPGPPSKGFDPKIDSLEKIKELKLEDENENTKTDG